MWLWHKIYDKKAERWCKDLSLVPGLAGEEWKEFYLPLQRVIKIIINIQLINSKDDEIVNHDVSRNAGHYQEEAVQPPPNSPPSREKHLYSDLRPFIYYNY